MKHLSSIRFLLLAATPLAGCYGPPSAEDRAVDSINGSITWGQSTANNNSQCTSAQMGRLGAVFYTLVVPRVLTAPAPLRACMIQQHLSPTSGAFAEEVLARLAKNVETHFYCDAASGEAWGPSNVDHEEVHFNPATLSSASDLHLAALMIREIARNKGYDDRQGASPQGERRYTVPMQLAHCLVMSAGGAATDVEATPGPARQPRDLMPLESELQPFGDLSVSADTASFPSLTCPTGTWAKGLGVCLSSTTPAAPIGFTLRCRPQNASVNTDLGACTPAAWRTCPTDSVAVGVHGSARATSVDALGLLCRRWSDLALANPPPPTELTASGAISASPSDPSRSITRICPPGQVMRSLSGAAQSTLESVRVVCQRPGATQLRGYVDLAALGGPSPTAAVRMRQRGFCADQGIATGLIGYRTSTGNLRRLGAVCRGAEHTTNGLVFRAQATEHVIAPSPGAPLTGDTEFGVVSSSPVRCPSGHGIVGVRIVRGGVDQAPQHVQGLCAPIRDWMYTTTPTVAVTFAGSDSAFGANVSETARCAQGSFLAGLEVRGMRATGLSYAVERIVPICRDFRPEQ